MSCKKTVHLAVSTGQMFIFLYPAVLSQLRLSITRLVTTVGANTEYMWKPDCSSRESHFKRRNRRVRVAPAGGEALMDLR